MLEQAEALEAPPVRQFTDRSGFADRAPISTAYSIALLRHMRFRFAVLAAALLPSLVRLIRSSTPRVRTVPGAVADAGRWLARTSAMVMAVMALPGKLTGKAVYETLGEVFLPFEGDRVLAVILSKGMMLAKDTTITDPTITRQIRP